MGPLDGVRVLEIADTQAGSVAGMLLADYGADVVRIDPPGSKLARAVPGFLAWNRGKQSLLLNLQSQEGLDILEKLLADADVLLETFGPGEAQAFNLDPQAVGARFPRLIDCSVTGYDRNGPDWGRPSSDGLVQARTGIMLAGEVTDSVPPGWAQPGHRPGPKFMGFPAASYAAAFYGTLGMLTALDVRMQTGKGQHVNSSLHGALWAMTRRAKAENATGASLGSGRGLGGIWECGDGEWVWTHTGARGSFDRYMKIFGLNEYMASAKEPMAWSPAVAQEVRTKVAAALKTQPRAYWVRLFDENDCPNAAARRPGEAYDDEQARVVDMVSTIEDAEYGTLEEVGLPIKFELTPGAIRGPAPRPGEHTGAILRSVGMTDADLSRLERGGVVAQA